MLDSKVVVITGGAGLIGKEFARAVTGSGGVAVIADIDKAAAENARKEIMENLSDIKGDVAAVELDITSEASLQNCIEELDRRYGHIDGLVNNAYPRNKNYGNHFFDVKYEDFVENVGLNLGGYFLTSQQFALYFKKQGYGNIVNISSIYGVIAPKFDIYHGTSMTVPVEYAAIKSALIHLTRYMAKYFKGENIRVNAISPGGILDNQPRPFLDAYAKECMTKGMLDKSDLNGTLLFLLSDMSRHITGQNIIVDDGFTL
ncbi:oxidoreductase [Hydrogenimonas sp. SS33]|uniref:oxidoreductase n=1 Tax=Hydrogenimonas leucolamina TaxID=2954236 RepID=UPI00336C1D71